MSQPKEYDKVDELINENIEYINYAYGEIHKLMRIIMNDFGGCINPRIVQQKIFDKLDDKT